ncbi:hypothetical protein ACVW0I_007206 [Bradyrhizobium sp. LM6.11]
MDQQVWADEAARCGMEPRGRLADLLAIAAGELFPHRLDDLEATRDLLQRLGHILADLRQPRSTAAGTGRRSLDNDALLFDVIRPWLAHRPLAHEGADVLRLRRCGLRGKLILARRGDEFFELQFQLLDQPRRALRALPVQFAFELLDPQLEMRDQRRVVRQLRLRAGSHRLGSQPGLTLGLQRCQGTDKIRWKVVRLRYHEAIESDQAADSNPKRLSDPRRTLGFLRVAPIDPGQQVTHLRRRDRHCIARNRRPDEPPSLPSFGEQACSLAIVPDHLHKVAAATSEDEQMTAERVFAKHLLHLQRQRRKASAHVRAACRKPHSRACRNRDDRRTKASRTRRSASPSTSPSTRMRCPTKIYLDDAQALPSTRRRRRQWRFGHLPRRHRRPNLDRHERRYTRFTVLAKLFAPPEQLAYMKASHASHLGNTRSGLERSCNKPFLLILRPPAPPLDRCDHLHPRNRHSASPRITPRTCSVRVRQTRRPSTEEYLETPRPIRSVRCNWSSGRFGGRGQRHLL